MKKQLCSSLAVLCFFLLFTYTSNATCVASFTHTVPGLTVSFTSTSTSSSGSTAGFSYFWNFGDSTTSTLKNPVKTFRSPGTRTIQLSIYDSLTNCSDVITDTVIVVPVSPSYCGSYFTATISSGLTVEFNNFSWVHPQLQPSNYYWNFGDGTTSILRNPIKTYSTSGVNIVSLTIYDSLTGCESSYEDTILVFESRCIASFNTSLNNRTVTFTNNSINENGNSEGLTYLWDFGDGTTSTLQNPVKTYATEGIFKITLYTSDSARMCFTSFSNTIRLSNPVFCAAHFVVAPDTITPFSFWILNTSIVRPSSSFSWNFGDGTTSSLKTPTHNYTNFGKYPICLTVFDSICTSTFCDTVGMDSNGVLLGKSGAFGFKTIDQTTLSTSTGNTLTEIVKGSVVIYPNPGNELVNISFSSEMSGSVRFDLFDITGKLVQTKEFISKSGANIETLDLIEYKPSIYFLKITTPNGQQVHKIIKN